jgi:hypothetical protein
MMMRLHLLLPVLSPLVLLATLRPAAAQETPRLAPGVRLRVTVADPADGADPVQVGVYRARTNATLRLADGAAEREIPLAAIRRLEWSRGRRPSLLGGIVGGILGVGIGGVVGCAVNRDSYGVFCGGQSATKVGAGGVLGGVAGAAAGALLFRRERWSPAELSWLGPGPP